MSSLIPKVCISKQLAVRQNEGFPHWHTRPKYRIYEHQIHRNGIMTYNAFQPSSIMVMLPLDRDIAIECSTLNFVDFTFASVYETGLRFMLNAAYF